MAGEGETPILEVQNLVKQLGGRRVLDGLSLKIPRGKTMVILGASGSGKSTLLQHLIGHLQPDSGQILYKGTPLSDLTREEMDQYRRKFGMLFQGAALFDSMTVAENVGLPLRENPDNTLSDSSIEGLVSLRLAQVGVEGFEEAYPDELSGGMKKRVGLARALILDPEIVFYDEPGAGLDPITLSVINDLIADLTRKLGVTSVVITHEMKSAFNIGDELAILHEGEIIATGTPEMIRASGDPYVQQFVHGQPPAREKINGADAGRDTGNAEQPTNDSG
jgi:phospholipid/cholesterol/gamma-HCH transport system ATP-binding protein